MLSAEYCLARAENMRILMLTASDPASELRLRGFILKYRALAERSKREGRPSSRPQLAVSNSQHLPAELDQGRAPASPSRPA
jgi:hypothetical protein